MKVNSRARLRIFIIAVIISAAMLYFPVKNGLITLGLDLQGGTYLLLEVESEDGSPVTRKLVNDTIDVINGRIDSGGTREAEVTREGGNRIRVSVPGTKDSQEAFNLIHQEGLLEVIEIIPTIPKDEVRSLDECIDGRTLLSGKIIENVRFGYEREKPAVYITFTPEACVILSDFVTAYHMERGTKFTLDGEVLSFGFSRLAPDDPPPTPELFRDVYIRRSDYSEIKRFYDILKSGVMPANVRAIEERTIGPSLGQNSMQRILVSGVIGMLLVLIFMALVYRQYGLMADLALIAYFVIVMFVLVILKVTFSLSSIAGLILGIGMAVDANIIIFERIREELSLGLSLKESLESGFKYARETIIDSNATTLLAAAILILFGSGIVRGFALTLSISILVSMFSALNITHWLLNTAIDGQVINSNRAIGIGGGR